MTRRSGLGSMRSTEEATMSHPRSMALRALVLALALLALSVSPVFAAKDVFVRSKPHVNVGTVAGQLAQVFLHAIAGVFADGDAVGIVHVRVRGGEIFRYRVTQGRAVVQGNTVVEVMLDLERVGKGGTPTGETDLAIVRPSSAAADCLIYDFVGPAIHLEVEGSLTLRHLGRR